MPDDKISIQQFAHRIKTKYPEYHDMDDTLLTNKILEKYPEYHDMVDMGVKKKEEPGTTSNQRIPTSPVFADELRNGLLQKGPSESTRNVELEKTKQLIESEPLMKERTDKAIKNTTERRLKSKGIKYTIGDAIFNKEKQSVQKDMSNGSLIRTKNRKGEDDLTRGTGFWESISDGFKNSVDDEITAAKVNTISNPRELANHLNELEEKKPKVYSQPSGIGGYLGSLISGSVKPAALFTAGEATNIAGGGLVAMGVDAQWVGMSHKRQQLYFENRDNLIAKGVKREDAEYQAADKAIKDAPLAALPETVTMVAMGMIGGKAAPELNTARQSFTNLVKNASKVGAIGASQPLSEYAIEKSQGYKRSFGEALDKVGKGFADFAMMDLAFHAMTHPTETTKYVISGGKEFLANVDPSVVESVASKLGQDGKKVVEDLQKYKKSRGKVESVTPQEIMPNVAGVQEAIDNKTKELEKIQEDKTVPQTTIDVTEQELNELKNKQSEMLRTGKGDELEVDHISGEKIIEPTSEENSPMILRHGQTDANFEGNINQPETEKLNKEGREQAKIKALKIKEEGRFISEIVTSPLSRSVETADAMKSELGEDVSIRTMSELEEHRNGESDKAFANRIKRVKEETDNLGNDKLLVTHGSVMRMMDALDKSGGDTEIAIEQYNKKGGIRHGNLEEYKTPKQEEQKPSITVLTPDEVKESQKETTTIAPQEIVPVTKKSGVSIILPKQPEVETANIETPVKGIEQVTPTEEIGTTSEVSENIKPTEETVETGAPIEPPTQPKNVLNGDFEGTPIKMSTLSDAKEYFRKLDIKNDTTADNAMNGLINDMHKGGHANVYEAAKEKVLSWNEKLKSGAKLTPNAEEVAQLGYFKSATERMMAEQSDLINSSIEADVYNGTSRFNEYAVNNEMVDAVIAAGSSEAGRAFQLYSRLFKSDADTSLKINKAMVMKTINPIVNQMKRAAKDRKDMYKADEVSINSEIKIEQIHKEETEIDKKISEENEKLSEQEFEKRVQDEVEKRLKDKKQDTYKQKNKKTREKIRNDINDFFEGAKLKGENLYAIPIPPKVINAGLEIMKQAVLAGETVFDAVNKAIEHISNEIKDWDKNKFRKEYEEKLNILLSDTPEAKKIKRLEKELGNIQQGIVKQKNEPIEDTTRIAELKEQIFEEKKKLGLIPSKENKPEHRLDYEVNREDILSKIKEISISEKSEGLTNSMVKKGFINDLVNTYVDEGMDNKKILNSVTTELRKMFPELDREKVRQAYLKEGEFKLPTKEQVNRDRTNKSNDLKRLEDLYYKLTKLKEEGSAYEAKEGIHSKKIERQSDEVQKMLDKELLKHGIDKETGTSDEKALNKSRLISHNERAKELSGKITDYLLKDGLTPESKSFLEKVKKEIDNSIVNDAQLSSIQSKEQLLKNTYKKILTALNNKEFKSLSVKGDIKEIKKSLENIKSEFEKEKNKSEIQLHIEATTKRLKNEISRIDKDIQLGNFEEKQPRPKVTNAEIIKLESQKRKKQAEYKKVADRVKEENMSWWQKLLKFGGVLYLSDLISGWTTTGAVAVSGLVKQPLESLTRGTTGQIAPFLFRNLSHGSGAEGRPTLKAENARYMAYFRQFTDKEVSEKLQQSLDKSSEIDKKHQEIMSISNDLKSKFGEDSMEYKTYVKNEVSRSLNKSTDAFLDTIKYSLLNFIGGSSVGDAANIMLKGSSRLEDLMGYKTIEHFGDLSTYEKTLFIVETMGRSHSVLKNFSARAEFAAGVITRMENRVRSGKDIRNMSSMLEVVNDAMNDYNRGKYQQSSFINEVFKQLRRGSEKLASENPNNPVYGTADKAFNAILKLKVPIAKTPLNILDEVVSEYMLGIFKGAALQLHGEYKALKDAGGMAAIKDVISGEREFSDLRMQMGESIKGMDSKVKDMILRAYRKGGFVGMLMMVGAANWITYGGTPSQGQKKKKKEEELGSEEFQKLPLQEQLNYGEISIGGNKLGKGFSHVITHSSIVQPFLYMSDYARVKENEIKKGKMDDDAIATARKFILNHVMDQIPYSKELNPLSQRSQYSIPIPFGRAIEQTQELVTSDKRKPLDWWDRTKMKIPGGILYNPTEVGYNAVRRTDKYFDKERKQLISEGATPKEILDVNKKQKELTDKLRQAKTKEEADLIIENYQQ